jgi:integrase
VVSAAAAAATTRRAELTLAPAVQRVGADLVTGYDRHVDGLPIDPAMRGARRRAARALLADHSDLVAWMRRPTPARVADLHRADAWPFISWCFVERHLRPDLELLLAKPGGVGLPAAWAARYPDDVAALTEAGRVLGWSANWDRQVVMLSASIVCLHTGRRVGQLTDADFTTVLSQLDTLGCVSASAREHARRRLFGLQQACYQLGLLASPPRRSGPVAHSPAEHAAAVRQPRIRTEVVRYVTTISTTLRPSTVATRAKAMLVFFDYMAEQYPQVQRIDQIDRVHVEAYLMWARQRPWRGPNGNGRTVGLTVFHQDVVDLRCFFEDIAGWGWTSAPARRLLFYSDIPRLPEPMPRALAPDVDRALMAAVARLDDRFVRTGLTLLRATGMRVGELLDLELDCLVDFAGHGTWLKVPIGKLGTERMVPLEPETLTVLDDWIAHRGPHRAIPHPRHGRPTEFLFLDHGTRPTAFRLRSGLNRTVQMAGLRGGGKPLHVTPHQLRHTFGTSLINGGIGLPALMALMGHVTPEMTLRYAKLASPTIRAAYQTAMDTLRGRQLLPIIAIGGAPVIPDRIEWLHAEMLKTRLAHGYCSRPQAAGACPYANICEQCDNFVPAPDATQVLSAQIDDVHALRADAQARGWDDEAARHTRVAEALQTHLTRLRRHLDR